jgi:hypothetical protein
MQKIDELTDEQVEALTGEDVERLIRRGMAEAGIPVLPRPVEPEYLDAPGPDQQVFEIGGVTFDNREAAEHVQKAISEFRSSRIRLVYGSGWTDRYVERDDSEQPVETRMAYSQKLFNQYQEVLEANAAAKRKYETAQREWRQNEVAAKDVREAIQTRVDAVEAKKERRQFLTNRFAEYVDIADGNRATALRFLENAFELTPEEEDFVSGLADLSLADLSDAAE